MSYLSEIILNITKEMSSMVSWLGVIVDKGYICYRS
jgi:hypothetical protein